MQQAIQVQRANTTSGGLEPAAPGTNAFVINLVSSTTPVALTRPDHAGLKRFAFFVSRRREDGRERFRLHMGYFDTQEEAERLLDIVRTIYPGAWAGLAPGRRLQAAGTPTPTPGPAAPVTSTTNARVAAGAGDPPSPASATPQASALALVPDEGRRQLVDVTEQQPRAAGRDPKAAARSLSNVRQTITSLDDAPTVRAATPPNAQIPELRAAIIPTLQPASGVGIVSAPTVASAAERTDAPSGAAVVRELSDTGTLRLLETGSAAKSAAGAPAPTTSAKSGSAPKARSTSPASSEAGRARASARKEEGALRQSRADAARTDKPYYAVQLMWSVQPIALSQVPQLAIFGAYTLYGAEGNRDGRRWYGLRLGFFTDAVSAKQVAHYVRGDFSTVSVVPVSERERDHAQRAVTRAGGADAVRGAAVQGPAGSEGAVGAAGGAKSRLEEPAFAFIDDLMPSATSPSAVSAVSGSQPKTVGRPLRPGGRPTRGAPGKRAKVRPPGQIHAQSRAKPKTLEETLEILGANQLQVDDEQVASLNDSGVRHLRLENAKGKPSKLLKLFDRLSERLGS